MKEYFYHFRMKDFFFLIGSKNVGVLEYDEVPYQICGTHMSQSKKVYVQ